MDDFEVIPFREFIQNLREAEIHTPYIILGRNVTPKLYECVKSIDLIKFKDGFYHQYCGEIKFIVNHFIAFWTEDINTAIRMSEVLIDDIDRAVVASRIEDTIQIHKDRHVLFFKTYLPARTPEEESILADINEKFEAFMQEMDHLKIKLQSIDRFENLLAFVKEQFSISLQRKIALFKVAHTHISAMLGNNVHKIRISLEECLLRVSNNLKVMQLERDDILSGLMGELFDKNKELMALARREPRSSFEIGELDFSINKLREKIEVYNKTTPIPRLENEERYWQTRIKDFSKIEQPMLKLKEADILILKQEEIYNSYICIDIGQKLKIYENIGKAIQKRKKYIKDNYIQLCKALLTFFGIRGLNRIVYYDYLGPYSFDDYGHRFYIFDAGKELYHIDCDGKFFPVNENEKYYFDIFGRYTIDEKGERVYQVAPCTSTYRLGEDNLLRKTTVDCGHSDRINPDCMMQLKDPNDVELLPETKLIDISSSMTSDVAKYIWDSVAYILPKCLYDIAEDRTNNPIHMLAHGIIWSKYRKNISTLKKIKEEAEAFFTNIEAKRDRLFLKQNLLFKDQQWKKRKPEEFADAVEKAVYGAYVQQQRFIASMYENFE